LNRSKIAAAVAKFQAGVLEQLFPKTRHSVFGEKFFNDGFFFININFPSNGFTKIIRKDKTSSGGKIW